MSRVCWLVAVLLTGCSTSADEEDLPTGDAPDRIDAEPKADAPPFELPPPTCGDGVLNTDEGEECDDLNEDDGDACVRCKHAVCGDGAMRRVFEQCDDGNLGQADGCTTRCLSCGGANQYAGSGGHCYTR